VHALVLGLGLALG